jgi:hypothetical protein
MLRRALPPAIVAVALLVTALPASASAVPAPHISKSCGLTAKGSRTYRVKARKVRCRFARRWAKRYLRNGSAASGFSCVKTSGGAAPWYCTKGEVKAYWVEKL